MEIPQMLHLEGKFFESPGCLLLVCRDDIGSREFTIYEMMKECHVWSVRLKKEDQARGLKSPKKRWLRMKSQRKADKDPLVSLVFGS
nr:hypothetical protein [Tanacetum cinerariifolium]